MSLTALPLYPFQAQALDALTTGRELIVLPTGGGKTVVFAHRAIRFVEANPGKRVLILVDRDELAEQAVTRLLDVAPGLDVGVVKAKRNDVTATVIVGSVQTLQRPFRRHQITDVGLVIVDEADLSIAPMYQGILGYFASAEKLGVTATPFRADGKSLYPTWERVAFQRDISWMIRHRYLIPLRGLAVEVPDLDLRTVKADRTDFKEGDLGEALAESLAPQKVVEAWLEHASDRRTLAFFPTIASCYVFAEAFQAAGVDARVVHGGLPDKERAQLFADHRAGLFPILVNCQIATVGYDDPELGCIIMGRPTRSKRLYIQIIGRGPRVDLTRPYEEQDCLVLDVVGANANHGDLCCIADLSEKKIRPEDTRTGRSLTELEDELDAGEGVPDDDTPYYTGKVEVREFDPLGQPSTRVWLKTKDGTYFVPAGTRHYVFIMEYPSAGRWSVFTAGRTNGDGLPAITDHRGLPLDQALVWAEDLALDMGADLNKSNKAAPWRKKKPSEKFARFATTLGLKPGPDERQGALSDRVDVLLGSRRLDPIVTSVKGKR